jgi:hypothetical protein
MSETRKTTAIRDMNGHIILHPTPQQIDAIRKSQIPQNQSQTPTQIPPAPTTIIKTVKTEKPPPKILKTLAEKPNILSEITQENVKSNRFNPFGSPFNNNSSSLNPPPENIPNPIFALRHALKSKFPTETTQAKKINEEDVLKLEKERLTCKTQQLVIGKRLQHLKGSNSHESDLQKSLLRAAGVQIKDALSQLEEDKRRITGTGFANLPLPPISVPKQLNKPAPRKRQRSLTPFDSSSESHEVIVPERVKSNRGRRPATEIVIDPNVCSTCSIRKAGDESPWIGCDGCARSHHQAYVFGEETNSNLAASK